MKTKLLFLTLLFATHLMSAQYYISEIVPSPPNNSGLFNDYTDTPLVQDFEYAVDDCIEYFEFRGPASGTIPADTYFIVIDGDVDSPGSVKEGVDLSGLTFGSNGILVIVANMIFDTGSLDSDGTTDISGVTITNPYATDLAASGANVVTIQLTGTPAWVDQGASGWELDKFNGVSKSPDIGYDGSINDQSSTYMIVGSAAGNPKNEQVDANADGVLDGAATAWTIYDSVSILDDDDGAGNEYAYGDVIFVELLTAAQINYNGTATVVTLNQYPNYVARQGSSTGYACTTDGTNNDDWMAGRVNSRSYPDWRFSSTGTRNIPSAELTSNNLSDFSGMSYGEVNVNFNPLSINSALATKFSVYPNPAKDILTIDSRNINISSVNVFSVLGTKVLERKELNDNKLDISSLSNGIYFLKISADNATVTKKFIVE